MKQVKFSWFTVCYQGVTLKGRKTVSKESVNAGEAIFVPCASPTHNSRPSTSATSSNFMVSSSSYETSISGESINDGHYIKTGDLIHNTTFFCLEVFDWY